MVNTFQIIGTFLLGVIFEVLYILFLHYYEANKRLLTVLTTMLLGALSVAGLASAINHPPVAVALILGYGCGCAIGMEIRNKL